MIVGWLDDESGVDGHVSPKVQHHEMSGCIQGFRQVNWSIKMLLSLFSDVSW